MPESCARDVRTGVRQFVPGKHGRDLGRPDRVRNTVDPQEDTEGTPAGRWLRPVAPVPTGSASHIAGGQAARALAASAPPSGQEYALAPTGPPLSSLVRLAATSRP
ncbi:hypothetical protein GCM10010219_65220 [Streptomyces netropsis]|nr:hypothetical protein GCM10010219_65220 [Streptomyces netropsis]